MRLELHPDARAELRSAALWYDERRPGLGDEFISEVSAALGRIGDAPRILSAMAAHAGRRPVDPQGDHPTVPLRDRVEQHEQHVLVLAVAHAKRRPLYWLKRTNP